MKKAVLLIIVLGILCAAQAQNRGGIELGFGLNGALPVGDLNIKTKFGVGGDVTLGYNINPKFAVLMRGGFISFIAKEKLRQYSVTTIGDGFIKLAGRYSFPGRLYLEPQLGFSSFRGGGQNRRAVRGNGFTYGLAAGYFIDKLKAFDVSLRYESTTNNETIDFVGLRFAYSIKPGTYF